MSGAPAEVSTPAPRTIFTGCVVSRENHLGLPPPPRCVYLAWHDISDDRCIQQQVMSTFCCWKAISSLMDSDVSNPHTITLQQRHVEELTLLWNPLLVQCVYGYNDEALIPILNFFFTLTHSGLTFSASITWLAFFSFYPLAAQHSSFLLHHNYFRQINGSSQSSFDHPWEYNPFHISCSYFLTQGSQTWDARFPEKNCSFCLRL